LENNKIIQLILDRAANGMEVIYIPGNHDTGLRNYAGSTVKGVRIEREAD
jgi:UDP-2,3-diacylglucosamine pyrophosphatase LpxH